MADSAGAAYQLHDTSGRGAWRSPRAWCALILVLAGTLLIDVASKYWAFEHVAGRPVVLDRDELIGNPTSDPTRNLPGRTILPWGLLNFKLVVNRGAVFGLAPNQRWFFIGFTAIALIVGLGAFAWITGPRQWLAHIGIALVLAGGIGNLYDRIVYGVVRDFLHMLPGWNLPFGIAWPGGSTEIFPWVFNIADVSLLVGMGLLLLHFHRVDKQRAAAEQSAGEKDDATRDHALPEVTADRTLAPSAKESTQAPSAKD